MGCLEILNMPDVINDESLTGEGNGDKCVLSCMSAITMNSTPMITNKRPAQFNTDGKEIPTHFKGSR